jgi:hypothetical protein
VVLTARGHRRAVLLNTGRLWEDDLSTTTGRAEVAVGTASNTGTSGAMAATRRVKVSTFARMGTLSAARVGRLRKSHREAVEMTDSPRRDQEASGNGLRARASPPCLWPEGTGTS